MVVLAVLCVLRMLAVLAVLAVLGCSSGVGEWLAAAIPETEAGAGETTPAGLRQVGRAHATMEPAFHAARA